MLNNILADFLGLNEVQANALINLMNLEQHWQRTFEWKGKIYSVSAIEMQSDLIDFIQAIGQLFWFKGHDRSKLPTGDWTSAQKEIYWNLFQAFGLCQEITSEEPSSCYVVLGSSITQVQMRTATMIRDLQMHVQNDPFDFSSQPIYVFGLGGNRLLGDGVSCDESDIQKKLEAIARPPTEMAMVDLIVSDAIRDAGLDDRCQYITIDAAGATSRGSEHCAKTADTAVSLTMWLETKLAHKPKPLTMKVFSNQPFVARQVCDMENKLGNDYKVIGVGAEMLKDAFNQNPFAINVCLGEYARIINTCYNAKRALLPEIPLSPEEKQVLELLKAPVSQGSMFQPASSTSGTENIISYKVGLGLS